MATLLFLQVFIVFTDIVGIHMGKIVGLVKTCLKLMPRLLVVTL